MSLPYVIDTAAPGDAAAIAALHAESWRTAYRGMLPDAFLDGPVEADRLQLWQARMSHPSPRQRVITAAGGERLLGFACVLLDEDPAWGALLDNLHVRAAERGHGIGARLLDAARRWVADTRGGPMYLWVLEANTGARRFYERHGGAAADTRVADVAAGISAPERRYVWPPLAGRGAIV